MDIEKILPLLAFILFVIERFIYTLSLNEPEGEIKDRVLTRVTLVSYILVLLIALCEYLIRQNTFLPLTIIGICTCFMGVVLRRKSIKALGKNWSIYIRDIKNQIYITKGPYAHIKHPYYLAVVLELFGISLILKSFYALSMLMIVQIPLLFLRIKREDHFINQKFKLN